MNERLEQKRQFLGYRNEHQRGDGAEYSGENLGLRSDVYGRLVQHIKRRSRAKFGNSVSERRSLGRDWADILGGTGNRHYRKLFKEQRAMVNELQAQVHGRGCQ